MPPSRHAATGAPLPNATSPPRLERAPHTVGERRDPVSQLASGDAAVERPVVPEDLDGAARHQRQAAEGAHAALLERSKGGRDTVRNSPWRLPAGQLRDDCEHALLRGVLAAKHIAAANGASFERRAVP